MVLALALQSFIVPTMPHPFGGDTPAEKLETYTFQMGPTRARLALAMDILTDSLILLGQNKVYTHQVTGKEKRDHDIDSVIRELQQVKRLLTESLAESK